MYEYISCNACVEDADSITFVELELEDYMYGELDGYEYGKIMEEVNKAVSTKGFQCTHNNAGWLGYYITTPSGKKYQLVKRRGLMEKGYYLCEYNPRPFCIGKSLELDFADIEECKDYLIQKENEQV